MAFLDGVQPRPSSWPVRRERRHFAAVTAHAATNDKLDLTMERLDRMERACGPPGLNHNSMADELVKQYRGMNAKIDTMLQMLQSSFDDARDFTTGATMQATPFLTWCGAILCQEALCVPQFAADFENRDKAEPEKELSPHKGAKQEDEAHEGDNDSMVVQLFDLFEGERMDGTTQTVSHEQFDGDEGAMTAQKAKAESEKNDKNSDDKVEKFETKNLQQGTEYEEKEQEMEEQEQEEHKTSEVEETMGSEENERCASAPERVFEQYDISDGQTDNAVQVKTEMIDGFSQTTINGSSLSSKEIDIICADGEWEAIPRDHVFSVGQVVKFTKSLTPDQNTNIQLPKNTQGIIETVDEEGDVTILFPELFNMGLATSQAKLWFMRHNFKNMMLRTSIT